MGLKSLSRARGTTCWPGVAPAGQSLSLGKKVTQRNRPVIAARGPTLSVAGCPIHGGYERPGAKLASLRQRPLKRSARTLRESAASQWAATARLRHRHYRVLLRVDGVHDSYSSLAWRRSTRSLSVARVETEHSISIRRPRARGDPVSLLGVLTFHDAGFPRARERRCFVRHPGEGRGPMASVVHLGPGLRRDDKQRCAVDLDVDLDLDLAFASDPFGACRAASGRRRGSPFFASFLWRSKERRCPPGMRAISAQPRSHARSEISNAKLVTIITKRKEPLTRLSSRRTTPS